ncbi:uncharacterized protein LOC115401593 [Salarias fasciatus]|uniref:uncharacterized protein LOC115401593 n=1 Tax=Salarias fasciatus TaxID=181472 RepID=UPI001176E249|nr:uncharacterized protein LOC115401593 [Salarias fasciatus]
MFTSYIKSLNDMVFSTSESPKEQPSTGVLGRIGSWFSPWRGTGPKTSSENAFSTSESEGEEDGEEYVNAQTGEQQWEDENPRPKPLFRDIFPREEEDATQSAHRDGSVVSSAETEPGGPEKEELAVCREQRKGQGERREEKRSGASTTGIPEENATHLTHLSAPGKQGVVRNFDQARTQSQARRRAQAQTGKRLHVYLEETSVIHCGQDQNAEQEVFRTTFTKSLHVLPKLKSSSGVDSEEARTNVRPAVEPQCHHSAPEGASLKANKDSQSESGSDKDQTDTTSMGRKNASRRRARKNSQGDGGNGPQEKSLPSTQPAAESTTPLTGSEGKGSDAHVCVESADSSPKLSSTSQASPGGGKSQTSCPDAVKELDNFQESNSEPAASQACAVDSLAEMDEDSFYKVERKTETPESKRRSMKVSRSEVKIFPKHVPFKPKPASGGNLQDTGKAEADGSVQAPKKAADDPKPVVGRLADRINVFEQHRLAGDQRPTFRALRSADVSPNPTATERLKAEFAASDQRSSSAERYGMARSGSASPAREKPLTIKERAKKFGEQSVSGAKVTLPQVPGLTGISQQPTPSVKDATSTTKKLDIQGELDTNQQAQTKEVSETNLKAGQDGTTGGVDVCTSKAQVTEFKGKETMASESDKTNAAAEEQSDSAQLSPHLKGPSRTGSRSKRRKSKEPTSPISPTNQNKPEFLTNKPEVTAAKQEQVDITEEAVSASKHPTETDLLPSQEAQENASSKQPPSDTKQKTFNKESEVPDKQKKNADASFEQKNIDKPADRQEGLPELSVNRDEPDTAACSSETKKPIDEGTVILPQKEEKAGRHSLAFTQEEKNGGENNRETSASSPPAVPAIDKSPAVKQDSRIESPKLDKELSMQLESNSEGKGRKPGKKETQQAQQPQNKGTEIQAEAERVEESEKLGSVKTNQTAGTDKEITHKFLPSAENTWKGKVLESGLGISGKVGSFVRDDERRNAEKNKEMQPGEDITKPEANQPELASRTSEKPQESSKPLVKTQHMDGVFNTHTEKASVSGVVKSNEAMSGSKNDKEPWKIKTTTNVPPELKKQSAEGPGTQTERPVIGPKPQPESVSVEKTQNSLDDSCAHGSNDAEFSSMKPITKAATAVEKVTVKVGNSTPELKPGQSNASNKEKSEYSVKEGSPLSVSESVSTEGRGNDDGKSAAVKSTPSGVKVPGDVAKLTPIQPQPGESKNKESLSSASTVKDTRKPPDAPASSPTLQEGNKSAEDTGNKLTPIANGAVSTNSQVWTVKEEPIINKPSQTPKAPTSPEDKKPSPDSTQRSSMKKLHLPRGLAMDDSSKWQDAPSSWLDVDFPKQKLKVQEQKLTSSGSESNLLDTPDLDDDDFIARIKNLCAPFSLPPRKHNPLGPAQPPFAMPAIREDRFEKLFDPEEFTIGLRKKAQFGIDTSQTLLSKLQTTETKSSIKPARASIADRCLLLGSMDTQSRLRDKTTASGEEVFKDEADDQIKVKSRLEGSCVLSSLTSSSFRGKRNGVQALSEGIGSGNASPSESPQVSPPPFSKAPPSSPTSTAPFKPMPAKQSGEEAQSAEVVVTDSGPPLPSFNDLKLPDYLQKYLPQDPAKPVQSARGQDQVKPEPTGKMTTPASGAGADVAVKPGPALPDKVAPRFPGIPPTKPSAVPELQQPPAQPTRKHRNNAPAVKRGCHKRPGKMVVFEKAQFGGQAYEIHGDLADATSLQLSPLISVKVVRGCWLLYEKPGFQGRTVALEEGGIELANMWEEPGPEKDPASSPPMLIGSIRLAVRDYSIPHIDLFTEPEGRGRVTPYHDDTIETGSFGIPLNTASIQVHSGVWLVCSDPGFQGMVAVLERGVYPVPESWGFPSPFVGSLRPLKMGGLKVENPDEVKAVAYEKPGFEGCSSEIDSDVFSFCEGEGDTATDAANSVTNKPKSVGSLKIIGGFWVGYSQPGFEGQQFILEEGEYLDCNDWGGSELLSLRPILSDFMTPHVKMFSDRDFGKLGVDIDLSVPVINMDDTGYGTKTQSIDVVSGVWVVFEEPGFCGELYVLEKGLYGSPEDWGAQQHRLGSTMPVLLDDFENTAKFKVQLFSNPGFQGSVLTLEDSIASPQDGFSVASCKVLAGSWLAFEGSDFTGKVYVLEEGSYPDLRAMGCVNANASILSLQPVGFEFSLPSITLFERCGLRGKRVVLTDGSVNLPFTGGCARVQSVLVEGGIWVLYEGINYRGAQILLKPGEVLNWHEFSRWNKIGSLRPLTQKQVHFRLRNKQTGLMLSVNGELGDVKLMRIQEEEETGGFEQIWFYHNGHLHCKMMEECCLSPIGSVTMAGSRLGLSPETADQTQRWSITPEGFVRYTHTSDLVLEIKGGHHYDKNQVILNTLDPNKLQQRWAVEIL